MPRPLPSAPERKPRLAATCAALWVTGSNSIVASGKSARRAWAAGCLVSARATGERWSKSGKGVAGGGRNATVLSTTANSAALRGSHFANMIQYLFQQSPRQKAIDGTGSSIGKHQGIWRTKASQTSIECRENSTLPPPMKERVRWECSSHRRARAAPPTRRSGDRRSEQGHYRHFTTLDVSPIAATLRGSNSSGTENHGTHSQYRHYRARRSRQDHARRLPAQAIRHLPRQPARVAPRNASWTRWTWRRKRASPSAPRTPPSNTRITTSTSWTLPATRISAARSSAS